MEEKGKKVKIEPDSDTLHVSDVAQTGIAVGF